MTLAVATGALASSALRGKTYEGGAPSWGSSEGHRQRTHAGGHLILRVAANGRSVTVRFSSNTPLFYCNIQESLHSQSSTPASISSSGKFRATVVQRFQSSSGGAPLTQIVSGQFSGHSVKGTIRTVTEPLCSGVASFSAAAR
jgi:hypothetical protein